MPSTGRNSRPTRGANYLLLDAEGAGHYVGCNLSVLQRAMGWWGEGDDMIRVDGESKPSLHGTGSEDYFSDAWGMREGPEPLLRLPPPGGGLPGRVQGHGLSLPHPGPRPVQEVHRGDDRARPRQRPERSPLVRRLLVPDRAPSRLPGLPRRRREAPLRLRAAGEFRPAAAGKKRSPGDSGVYVDRAGGLRMSAPRLSPRPPSYYNAAGVALSRAPDRRGRRRDASRIPLSGRGPRSLHDRAPFSPVAGGRERPGPRRPRRGGRRRGRGPGPLRRLRQGNDPRLRRPRRTSFSRPAPTRSSSRPPARTPGAPGYDIFFVGFGLKPAARRFIREWNLVGPFDAADMDDLPTVYPPETETEPAKKL